MRLVLIATSANQSYIFASNRLREAVGASELVRLSTTTWVHEAVTAAGPGRADVVQESSGTTLLVVDGLDGGADRARRVVNALTRRAMRDAPGMDVTGAWIPIDGPVPTPADIDAVFRAHGDTVARRVSTLGRGQRLPTAAACASTDRPATTPGVDRLIERIKAVHSLTADRGDGRIVSEPWTQWSPASRRFGCSPNGQLVGVGGQGLRERHLRERLPPSTSERIS